MQELHAAADRDQVGGDVQRIGKHQGDVRAGQLAEGLARGQRHPVAGAARLRPVLRNRPEPAYLYSMRRLRPAPRRLASPASGTGDGIPGHALNPALARKAFDRLTALGRAAATRFNERPRAAPRSGS